MRIWVTASVWLLLSASAEAADLATFEAGVVTLGDRIGKVYEVAGTPNRVIALPAEPGKAAKKQFEYVRNGVVTRLTLSGGIVVAID